MKPYMNQSEATRILASEQTHDDMHAGRGVLEMPTHQDIARRAYEIYLSSGATKGHCTKNWLQAEHELEQAAHQS